MILKIMVAFVFIAFSDDGRSLYIPDHPLPSGAEVSIIELDSKKKMVKVLSVKYPGEGPSWLLTSDFSQKIDMKDSHRSMFLNELNKSSEKLIGRKFTINQEIKTYVRKDEIKVENK